MSLRRPKIIEILVGQEISGVCPMLPQLELLPGAISEIMVSTSRMGYLTVADRYGLLAAILDDSLEESERRCVNRLVRSVWRGRLEVTNILS